MDFLRENFPFGRFSPDVFNERINVFKKNITAKVISSEKNPELVNTIVDVVSVNRQGVIVNNNARNFLPVGSFELFFKDTKIELSDLIAELAYKNANIELDELFYAKIKNGFLSDYPFKLEKFFCQNEENFFLLRDCLINNKFCFPKWKADKESLLNFIETTQNEKMRKFAEENFYEYEELHPQKTSVIKR